MLGGKGELEGVRILGTRSVRWPTAAMLQAVESASLTDTPAQYTQCSSQGPQLLQNTYCQCLPPQRIQINTRTGNGQPQVEFMSTNHLPNNCDIASMGDNIFCKSDLSDL
jgi:hypothetical protein